MCQSLLELRSLRETHEQTAKRSHRMGAPSLPPVNFTVIFLSKYLDRSKMDSFFAAACISMGQPPHFRTQRVLTHHVCTPRLYKKETRGKRGSK